MFSISQKRGMTYVVNGSHILSLKPSGKQLMKKFGETLNINIKSYLKLPKWQRDRLYGYKVGVDFPEKQLSLDPYILGLWLGDGSCAEPAITTPDPELKEAIYKFSESINNFIRIDNSSSCPSYHIVAGRSQAVIKLDENLNFIEEFKNACDASRKTGIANSNISTAAIKGSKTGGYFWKRNKNNGIPFKLILRSLNVLNNKHIPFDFSRNSRKNRLELLAGLVDTDGYYTNKAGYEIIQKNEQLANDIVWLSRSLGFYTSINPKLATMKRKDGTIYSCPVFRIQIYGAVNQIPCRVKRKQAKINTPNKDNTRGQLVIKSIGEGEYYGFNY
jgi:replicative DNA helicase